jgi:hypothetical protein
VTASVSVTHADERINSMNTNQTPAEFAEFLRKQAATLRAAHKVDRARELLIMSAAILGFSDKIL